MFVEVADIKIASIVTTTSFSVVEFPPFVTIQVYVPLFVTNNESLFEFEILLPPTCH